MEAAARAIDSAEIARHVHFLASDPLLGRSTLEPGYDSAAAYVARQLRALGATPAGDSGGYFQHYTVVSSRLDTARVSGRIGDTPIRYGDHFIVQAMLHGGRLEGGVVYVGNGTRIPALGIDPYAGLDVRGKWLLVDANAPFPRPVTAAERGLPGRDHFTANDVAVERGALGILALPTPGIIRGWESFLGRVPTGRDLTPAKGRAYAANPVQRVALSVEAARQLLAERPEFAAIVAANDTAAARPAPFALRTPVVIDLAATTTTYRPYNVVALVEGSDPARRDQWISVASHLDGAVGRAVTPEGDSVYNAADDNASGSAVDLAVIRAVLAGPRPARSILFIWDSGEEIGLWGSRHLAYNASDRIVAHFNNDMLGRTKAPGSTEPAEENLAGPNEVWVSGPAVISTMMHRVLEAARARYDWVTLTPRHDDPSVSFFYPRTDAAPYMEVGIPVIQFFTGLHADYHRQGDESAKLDIAKMTGAARMIYAILWAMADDPERPRWDKPVPAQLYFVTPRP